MSILEKHTKATRRWEENNKNPILLFSFPSALFQNRSIAFYFTAFEGFVARGFEKRGRFFQTLQIHTACVSFCWSSTTTSASVLWAPPSALQRSGASLYRSFPVQILTRAILQWISQQPICNVLELTPASPKQKKSHFPIRAAAAVSSNSTLYRRCSRRFEFPRNPRCVKWD